MCIYSNATHPSTGVDHIESRHVVLLVIRQMLLSHPTPIFIFNLDENVIIGIVYVPRIHQEQILQD